MQVAADNTPQEVDILLEQRAAARAAKDYTLSDTLRDKIKEHGYTVWRDPPGIFRILRPDGTEID